MTTLKEYKAMIDGATDAPWKVLEVQGQEFISAKPYEGHPYFGCSSTIEVMSEDDYPTKSADVHFLAASRNIAPELIRAIELAEELLNDISDCPAFVDQATVPKNGVDANPQQVVLNMSISLIKYRAIDEALSEIRKLKGE